MCEQRLTTIDSKPRENCIYRYTWHSSDKHARRRNSELIALESSTASLAAGENKEFTSLVNCVIKNLAHEQPNR